MRLFWEVTYRAGSRRVHREFTDVLEFNQFVTNYEGEVADLVVSLKLKAELADIFPALLPRMLAYVDKKGGE